MSSERKYVLRKTVPKSVQKNLKEYESLLQQLLYNRGIKEADTANTFLNPNYEKHLNDPFLFTDINVAIDRILSAIENKEHIAIYSDYDCDGIPGGVILHDFFKAISFENFENYIPHRHYEGYGLNVEAVDKLTNNGTKLLITIDCGITDNDSVKLANKKGIDVIITDHHEQGESLPEALAIINPKVGDSYPFKGLCGSAVIFKVIQAVIIKGKEKKILNLGEGQEKWLLDLVGLATVADMVPLTEENRVLAHYGLRVLRKSKRPGLQHLLKKAGGSQQHITEDDIGFTIGPRINAASRMDNPEDAFNMLATKDEAEAGKRVAHLEKLNNERKGAVAAMTKEAKKKILTMNEIPAVIVLGNPEWKPSLVGLVANTLSETYRRSAYVWGRDGNGVIKGSCRSYESMSILTLMEEASELFEEFGGHHAAGGFAIKEDEIHTFDLKLNKAYKKLMKSNTECAEECLLDADISLSDIDNRFINMLSKLSPFGVGNHKPVFRFIDVIPISVDVFGKIKNHTKLIFDTANGKLEAIAFFKLPDNFSVTPEKDNKVTLIGSVEESYFMGRKQTRIRIVDII